MRGRLKNLPDPPRRFTQRTEARYLQQALREIARWNLQSTRLSRHELPGHPLDRELLTYSPLYRKSRELFLRDGGELIPSVASSGRSLSSSSLLTPEIEYGPIRRELFWSATDPLESRRPERLLTLRSWVTSLFHEQNHRVLWRLLPPIDLRSRGAVSRHLNWAESLVIALDMALGDELGPKFAGLCYRIGATYDPGTDIKREGHGSKRLSCRRYRNYLQAALYATYLNLELYDPTRIPKVIGALYPDPDGLSVRAAHRALQLDRAFVVSTNRRWQKLHGVRLARLLEKNPGEAVALPEDPLDNRLPYLFGERWFETFGL